MCLLLGTDWNIIPLFRVRQSVADLSPPRPDFNPRPVQVGFVVGIVSMGQVFLRVHLLYLVSVLSPVLNHVHVSLNRRTKGRSFGTF